MKNNIKTNLFRATLFLLLILSSYKVFPHIDKSKSSTLDDAKEFFYSGLTTTPCMTLTINVKDETCSGYRDDTVSIIVNGGQAPYFYNILSTNNHFTGNSTNHTFLNLSVGTHSVQVTSANGCVVTETFVINSTNTSPTITTGTQSLCPGQTATLTASGANTYTWTTYTGSYPTNTTIGASITASYSPNLYYYVKGTGSNGCISLGVNASLIYNPSSVNTDVTPTNTICIGGSVTLFAGGGTTYTWNPGGITTSSVVVSPTVTTVYTVTSSGICFSNISVTNTITVNPYAVPIINISGTQTVCSQQSYTYTATGASTYTWSAGTNDLDNTVINPIQSFVGVGQTNTLTVRGTDINGCVNTGTLNLMNISPGFSLTGSSKTICSGTSYTLNAVIPDGATYTWTPSLSGLNPVIEPTDTSTYSLSVSNSYCTLTKSVEVNVIPSPTISLISPVNICNGSSYTISPSVYGTLLNMVGGPQVTTGYIWSPATNLSSASTATTIASGITGSVTYTLTASNIAIIPTASEQYGTLICQNEELASITINTTPGPTLSVIGNPIICSNTNVDLSVSGALTYTWSNGSNASYLIVYDVQNGGTVPIDGSQVFTVTGADASGCTSVASYTVSDYTPTFTVNPNNDNPPFICSGSSYTLSAELGPDIISYSWSPDNLSGLHPVVTPTVTSGYELTASNGTCSATHGVEIAIVPTPTVTVLSPEIALCPGNSYTVLATVAQIHQSKGQQYFFSGTTNYDWIPTNGLSSTNTATTVATPSTSTTYSLISTNHYYPANIYTNDTTFVVDTLFCSDTSRVTINVTPNPPTPTINYSTVCDSNFTTLSISVPNSTYTYTWNGPCYNGNGSSVNVNSVGIYTVNVTNSCGVVTTNTVNVLLIGNIVAGFQTYIQLLEGDEGIGGGSFIHFENLSLGNNLIYDWTFGNGDTSIITNPNEHYNNIGVFNVNLYDSDSLNCKDTASATIVVSAHNTILIIPNSFYPK